MIIAVDFDGTIVEHRYPAIGEELPFAIETLKQLTKDGHKLILWTAREGKLLDDAVEFCHSRGLDFYAVNSDLPSDRHVNDCPSRKLKADVFIDDRNLGGLPEWAIIYEMISHHLTFGDIMGHGGEDIDTEEEPGFFARLLDRCQSSRVRFGGSSGRHHRHHF